VADWELLFLGFWPPLKAQALQPQLWNLWVLEHNQGMVLGLAPALMLLGSFPPVLPALDFTQAEEGAVAVKKLLFVLPLLLLLFLFLLLIFIFGLEVVIFLP
jgi:hypothetical protein